MRRVSWPRQVTTVCLMVSICMAISLSVLAEDDGLFLGVVDDGRFWLLAPSDSPWLEVGLTLISMQESVPPETWQLDLQHFEGQVLVVRGYNGGGWIYSAGIVEIVRPLLAQLILSLVPPLLTPCEACLETLNSATREDFEEVDQIGSALSALLEAARPFVLSDCRGAIDIERLLDDIPDINVVLRERIVLHFCPDLYE